MAITRVEKIGLIGITVLLLPIVWSWWTSVRTPPISASSPSSSAGPVYHRPAPSSGAQPIYYGPDGNEVAASVAAKQRGKGDAASKPARSQRRLSKPSSSSRWFEGGNLHRKTVRAWRKASHRNRLATSGDFVAALAKKDGYTSFSLSDLKKVATTLEICISAAAEPTTPKIPGHGDMEIAEFAASCIYLLTTTASN